jgi:hypothetical protein
MDPLTLSMLLGNAAITAYQHTEDTRKAKQANELAATRTRYTRTGERPGFTEKPNTGAALLANLYDSAPLYAQMKAGGIGQDWGGWFQGDAGDPSAGPRQGPSPLGATPNDPWEFDFSPQKAGPMPAGALPGTGVALINPEQGMDPAFYRQREYQQEAPPSANPWDVMTQNLAREQSPRYRGEPQTFLGH